MNAGQKNFLRILSQKYFKQYSNLTFITYVTTFFKNAKILGNNRVNSSFKFSTEWRTPVAWCAARTDKQTTSRPWPNQVILLRDVRYYCVIRQTVFPGFSFSDHEIDVFHSYLKVFVVLVQLALFKVSYFSIRLKRNALV